MDEKARRREELRSVIAMAIPMVVTTCTRMVMDVTDYAMVSRLPDLAPKAALLPGQMLLWTYIVTGMGTVSIVATFASQCLGKGRRSDCSAYAWQGIYLSACFAAACLACRPLFPRLVAWIGHDPAVQAQELKYCAIALWTVGPTIAAEGFAAFFNGVHHPRITMWSALEAIAINFVVSCCLIFGLFGCPQLGIAGAAWGTVVATSYRMVRLAVTMCLPRFHEQFGCRRTWVIDLPKIGKLLRFGLPQGGQWFSDVMVWALFVNVLVGSLFGTEHLIATNVAWQYLRISFLPAMGVGMALTTLVGKTIGAGEPQRAMRVTRIALCICMGYMGTLSLVYLIWRSELIGLFNADERVIAIGSKVMICAVAFQVFDALGVTYHSALRGAGDTLWASVMFVVTHWVIVIGGGFCIALAAPGLGSLGPWIAASVLIILSSLLLGRRWHGLAWMKIDLFSGEAATAADSVNETPAEPAVQS